MDPKPNSEAPGGDPLLQGAVFIRRDGAVHPFVLKGADAKTFLQGLVSADVAALSPVSWAPSCLLSPKGTIEAILDICDAGPSLMALVDREGASAFDKAISKMIPLSHSTLLDAAGGLAILDLAGPGSLAAVQAASGTSIQALPPRRGVSLPWNGGEVLVLSYPTLMPDGLRVLLAQTLADGFIRSLQGAGAAAASAGVLEPLRIEKGVPIFGIDVDADTLPLEANLDESISWTKGCYMGQETMARIKYRGHVNRRLVTLKINGTDIPWPGTPVFAAGGEVGITKSATYSSRLNAVLALAMIRASSIVPNMRLRIGKSSIGQILVRK